jgi:hypothetical protein
VNLRVCQHVVVYPISGAKIFNVVAVIYLREDDTAWRESTNIPVDQAEFFSHFKGWEEELQALISVRSINKW